MKLYALKYYKDFKCIAGKCEHSCCIGWEIDIDADTLKKYKKLSGGYGKAVKESISAKGTPHFKLSAEDRCPHLDENGLCRIILNLGEDYLCDICREHPRFYNFTDVAEVGLGMSCVEAARVILASPDFAEITEIGEVDAEPDGDPFNGRALRGEIFSILCDTQSDHTAALKRIYQLFSVELAEDSRYLTVLGSMEYLDASHKELFMKYSSSLRPEGEEKSEYLKRFLAYLVYRHCTEAFDPDDFRERLAFCLFGERLLASLTVFKKAETLSEIAALASIISEEIEYSEENTEGLMLCRI